MVLHVAADAPQFVHDGDADVGQVFGVADARELQDVGRPDGPGRQDHLTRGRGPLDRAATGEVDADGTLALEHDAMDHGLGDQGQVPPGERLGQVGAGGRGPPASVAGLLAPADRVDGPVADAVHVFLVG